MVIEWYMVGAGEVLRAILRKGIRRRHAVHRGKFGEIGDGPEHALDVSGVVEVAQKARDFLVTDQRKAVHLLLDVEKRNDLIDGEKTKARKRAEDGEHAIGDPDFSRGLAACESLTPVGGPRHISNRRRFGERTLFAFFRSARGFVSESK